MNRFRRLSRGCVGLLVGGLLVTLLLAVAAGCGEEKKATDTKATGKAKGKLYIAVTGSGEPVAGAGPMGYAVIDLETKQVEMINIPESKAPHGIAFTADTKTASNTRGRVATEDPKSIYLGNSTDGSVLKIDLASKKVTKTITGGPGITPKICGMQVGPDGIDYMSSMSDGKLYPLNMQDDTIGSPVVGGGDASSSICGVGWSSDNKYIYLSNMQDKRVPDQGGYVAKLEWPSGKLVKKIENVTKPLPSGALLAHQIEITPDGKYMYVCDSVDGSMVKIDMSTEQVVKTVPVGKDPHSIVFSSDGKTAYIAVRKEPDEKSSSVFVYDVEKDEVIDRIPGLTVPQVCSIILVEK